MKGGGGEAVKGLEMAGIVAGGAVLAVVIGAFLAGFVLFVVP